MAKMGATIEQKMIIKGHEKDSDAERIFALIDYLKSIRPNTASEPVQFFNDIKTPWRVVFKGEPSLRHANKIAIFREFLSELLVTDLRVSGGSQGSLAVDMAPKAEMTSRYIEKSENLFLSNSAQLMFKAMAQKLEISEIGFGEHTIALTDAE
jgi:hypothetical protein